MGARHLLRLVYEIEKKCHLLKNKQRPVLPDTYGRLYKSSAQLPNRLFALPVPDSFIPKPTQL